MLYGSMAILIAMMGFGADAPETRATAIVKLPDGTTAAVFWDDRQKQVGKDWIRVEYDEPWLSQPRYWKGRESDVSVERTERQNDREKRIRAGWEQVGFVEVNGRRVPKTEAELAQKAKEMAGLNQENPTPAPPPAAEAPAHNVTAPPRAPGFVALWGAHIAVLACAAILLAVALKVFFLSPGK